MAIRVSDAPASTTTILQPRLSFLFKLIRCRRFSRNALSYHKIHLTVPNQKDEVITARDSYCYGQ